MNPFTKQLKLGLKARKKKSTSGFSLLELLLAVVIVGIIGAAVVYAFPNASQVATQNTNAYSVSNLNTLLSTYRGVGGVVSGTPTADSAGAITVATQIDGSTAGGYQFQIPGGAANLPSSVVWTGDSATGQFTSAP